MSKDWTIYIPIISNRSKKRLRILDPLIDSEKIITDLDKIEELPIVAEGMEQINAFVKEHKLIQRWDLFLSIGVCFVDNEKGYAFFLTTEP